MMRVCANCGMLKDDFWSRISPEPFFCGGRCKAEYEDRKHLLETFSPETRAKIESGEVRLEKRVSKAGFFWWAVVPVKKEDK